MKVICNLKKEKYNSLLDVKIFYISFSNAKGHSAVIYQQMVRT
jgi:hypothetical protein